MNNEILNEKVTTPPETWNVAQTRALKRRSETARLQKSTWVSRRWEQLIARRAKSFESRKDEKATGRVTEFIRWIGHAVEHEHKRIQQRRAAATFAIDLANHKGVPQIRRRRQLSKQWRRLYDRAAPKETS